MTPIPRVWAPLFGLAAFPRLGYTKDAAAEASLGAAPDGGISAAGMRLVLTLFICVRWLPLRVGGLRLASRTR
eukprot:144207-Amphidinium_carterae.1